MQKGLILGMEKALGQILVKRNIITQEMLDLALKRQEQGKGKYLGEILIEMGIPQDEINKALDSFDKRKRIGQILVDSKIITPHQLEEALEEQRRGRKRGSRIPLGKVLVEMGYITYEAYLKVLSKHFNMPIVSLKNFSPSPALQRVIGERYAEKHMIVVLKNTAETIKLALAEPTFFIMEELRKGLPKGKRIEFCLAPLHEIQDYFRNKSAPFLYKQK